MVFVTKYTVSPRLPGCGGSERSVSINDLRVLRYWPTDFDRTVIVAMIAVGMMENSIHQIINMIAMRHRLVAAPGTMLVFRIVFLILGELMAALRIGLADGKDMILNCFPVLMNQVTIDQEIDVAIVFHGHVTATRTVGMHGIRHDNLRTKESKGHLRVAAPMRKAKSQESCYEDPAAVVGSAGAEWFPGIRVGGRSSAEPGRQFGEKILSWPLFA